MTSLWRLRKRNHRGDAHLEETASGSVELRFAYDGRRSSRGKISAQMDF